MSALRIPKNKFLKLLFNLLLMGIWFCIYAFISGQLLFNQTWTNLMSIIKIGGYYPVPILICFLPMFSITRYIWFEKSRKRIFYGLFDKLNLKKFEPRIYTTNSNADELKKYAELRDKGVITEEEFQSKKKKLLDL